MIEKRTHIPIEDLNRWENFEGLMYQGYDPSALIFPHIGVSWQELQSAHEHTGLPISDIGSSFSSFPAEAAVRGIPVVPIDVMRPHRSGNYYEYVRAMLDEVSVWDKELETKASRFDSAIAEVEERYLSCEVSEIALPDQSFCISIVHDCVPKHSNSLEEFVTKQLPEILRTTRGRAFVFPLEMHRGSEGAELERILDVAATPSALSAITEVARNHGFSFATARTGRRDEVPSAAALFERISGHVAIDQTRSRTILDTISSIAWKEGKAP